MKTAKKIIDRGYNNQFNCIMSNSYMHDFVDARDQRNSHRNAAVTSKQQSLKNI